MTRLTKLDAADFRYLGEHDKCVHLGEYTSGGGFQASTTNQQIYNLKHRPSSPDSMLYWKRKAVAYWGNMIASTNLNWEYCLENATFVPFPSSKPTDHAEYDPRVEQVLRVVARHKPGLDVRPVLRQSFEREPQHTGNRLTPDEIAASLTVDIELCRAQLKETVIVVDDVITRGSSFSAAKSILSKQPGVSHVLGLFLAKTIWEDDDDWADAL